MAIYKIRKRRDGSYIVETNLDYMMHELGPYADRKEARKSADSWTKHYREEKYRDDMEKYAERISRGRGRRDLLNGGLVDEGGNFIFEPHPMKKPSWIRHRVGGFFFWPVVEVRGLPVIFNRWIFVGILCFVGLLLMPARIGSETSDGHASTLVAFPLETRVIIGLVIMAFASPFLMTPFRKTLWFILRIIPV